MPGQWQLLAKIAAGLTFQEHYPGLLSGQQPGSRPALPDRAELVDALGRFRHALLLDELKRRPPRP